MEISCHKALVETHLSCACAASALLRPGRGAGAALCPPCPFTPGAFAACGAACAAWSGGGAAGLRTGFTMSASSMNPSAGGKRGADDSTGAEGLHRQQRHTRTPDQLAPHQQALCWQHLARQQAGTSSSVIKQTAPLGLTGNELKRCLPGRDSPWQAGQRCGTRSARPLLASIWCGRCLILICIPAQADDGEAWVDVDQKGLSYGRLAVWGARRARRCFLPMCPWQWPCWT
jgi:hypothetical protein